MSDLLKTCAVVKHGGRNDLAAPETREDKRTSRGRRQWQQPASEEAQLRAAGLWHERWSGVRCRRLRGWGWWRRFPKVLSQLIFNSGDFTYGNGDLTLYLTIKNAGLTWFNQPKIEDCDCHQPTLQGGPWSAGVVPPHAPRRAEGEGGATATGRGGWWVDGFCLKMADFHTPNGKMMVNRCGGTLYFQSQMEFYQSLLVLFSPANACNSGMITCRT